MSFQRPITRRLLYVSLLGSALSLLIGCAAQRTSATSPEKMAQSDQSSVTTQLSQKPVAFLEQLLERTDKLQQYELTFYRQERHGAFVPKLGPMEQIHARFRKQPFSVKFEWPLADSDYYESVYVEGENNNKLTVRERKGLLGFRPQTRVVNVMDPVTFGRSKNPITDFGLAQVTRRTLIPIHDPAIRDQLTIKYEGVVNLDPMNRPAHHLRLEHPPAPNLRYTHQDFYIDTQTLLPAGTDLYLPDGNLDARYRYTDVRTTVELTNADFRLGHTGGS